MATDDPKPPEGTALDEDNIKGIIAEQLKPLLEAFKPADPPKGDDPKDPPKGDPPPAPAGGGGADPMTLEAVIKRVLEGRDQEDQVALLHKEVGDLKAALSGAAKAPKRPRWAEILVGTLRS